MPEPQHLLVLVGLPVGAKATLAATLAHTLHAAGRTVTLLDNSDRPLRLAFPTVRLPAGCVCCTVIEYIISERLFLELPDTERHLWHPHNYEVFSGELDAPGLPEVAERELMSLLVNSYGKTWHLWHTGRHDGQPGHALPVGDAMLMWSFNRDGG